MGKHTLHTDTGKLRDFTEGMKENRDMMIELCGTNELMVMNTMYRKRPERIATYRKSKESQEEQMEEITKDTHEQLDYTLAMKRWRNSVTNAESDTKANVNTDHYPVTMRIRIKLKANTTPTGKGRERYEKCNEEQNEEYNQTLANASKQNTETEDETEDQDQERQQESGEQTATEEDEETHRKHIKEWLNIGKVRLPTIRPKDRYRKHILSERTTELLEKKRQSKKRKKTKRI